MNMESAAALALRCLDLLQQQVLIVAISMYPQKVQASVVRMTVSPIVRQKPSVQIKGQSFAQQTKIYLIVRALQSAI